MVGLPLLDFSSITVRFHGKAYCTGSERQPYDNCAKVVRLSQKLCLRTIFFCPILRLLRHGRCAISAQGLCRLRLPVNDFIKSVITSRFNQNRRSQGAHKSIRKWHGRRLPPHGGRTQRDTGSADSCVDHMWMTIHWGITTWPVVTILSLVWPFIFESK